MKEIWKDIKGYEGLYQVSDLGRVRNNTTNKYLKSRIRSPNRKYSSISVTLAIKGVQHQASVHRLIAEAFIPNPDCKQQVNHIDGNPRNNQMSNLEWCTASENVIHAKRLGLLRFTYGENAHNVKLKESYIPVIKELYKRGYKQRQIAEYFLIGQNQVSRIINGKRWNYLLNN